MARGDACVRCPQAATCGSGSSWDAKQFLGHAGPDLLLGPWLYLGMFSGWAGSGRAGKKPDSKICCPGPARPDCRVVFCYPSPARLAKKTSGCRAVGLGLPKICQIFYPGPTRLVNRAKFLCPGPAHRAKIRGRAGPFSGRAGSGRRAGLPMLRYSRGCAPFVSSAPSTGLGRPIGVVTRDALTSHRGVLINQKFTQFKILLV
jgi:hypothetical protein